jgi:transposase
LHVLDRFHITSHLNQAVDQVRRAERTHLGTKSQKAAQRLKHMRWPLLRRGSRVRGRARQKLNALLASKLATARAWELKETFSYFWKYQSVMGRRLSRLLVLPGHAQPPRTYEKGSQDAARP